MGICCCLLDPQANGYQAEVDRLRLVLRSTKVDSCAAMRAATGDGQFEPVLKGHGFSRAVTAASPPLALVGLLLSWNRHNAQNPNLRQTDGANLR